MLIISREIVKLYLKSNVNEKGKNDQSTNETLVPVRDLMSKNVRKGLELGVHSENR